MLFNCEELPDAEDKLISNLSCEDTMSIKRIGHRYLQAIEVLATDSSRWGGINSQLHNND